ncbi:MAG: exodeoxyribonuclease III [Proteobacteria bacterium]|nr:exodeoxyribonuclease III [Pseudomonadota bacterium]
MKIITWNINSVRLRMPLIKQLVAEQNPDILCLQETKAEDHVFPALDLKSLGFTHLAFAGQKSYNGVCILSKVPLTNIMTERFVNDDKRHIRATLPNGTELHNFYIPAGGDIPDTKLNPKYDHKLRFVEEMTAYFTKKRSKKDSIIILGDFNIAPLEHDVWSSKQLQNVVSHTPPERERIEKLRASLAWVDSARHFVPENEKLYSWWSYRNQDWRKSNRGRRLDHIWVTPVLEKSLKATQTLVDSRDWASPSDHVPVIIELKK